MIDPQAGKDTQFKPGVSGNPNGKPKGRRSLSTIIKDMMEEPIDWNLVPIKDAESLAKRYGTKAAWEALVAVAYSKAMAGDTKAMGWLSRSGYGDKLTHDIDPGLFAATKMRLEIVRTEDPDQRDTESGPGAAERPADS